MSKQINAPETPNRRWRKITKHKMRNSQCTLESIAIRYGHEQFILLKHRHELRRNAHARTQTHISLQCSAFMNGTSWFSRCKGNTRSCTIFFFFFYFFNFFCDCTKAEQHRWNGQRFYQLAHCADRFFPVSVKVETINNQQIIFAWSHDAEIDQSRLSFGHKRRWLFYHVDLLTPRFVGSVSFSLNRWSADHLIDARRVHIDPWGWSEIHSNELRNTKERKRAKQKRRWMNKK